LSSSFNFYFYLQSFFLTPEIPEFVGIDGSNYKLGKNETLHLYLYLRF